MHRTVIYYGNSMHRVFKFGEHLVLEKISFNDLQTGDIIVVNPSGKKQYVHRVVEKDAFKAVTMGDNNSAADETPVTSQSEFYLVSGVLQADKSVRSVLRGSAGMQEFYRNQRIRKFRLRMRKWLFRCEKLFFWRKTLLEKKVFNEDVCYYWKNRAVARVNSSGKVTYVSWRDFLQFKVPEECDK